MHCATFHQPPPHMLYITWSEEDPFMDLINNITRFSNLGKILIIGDFNARTNDLQTPLHDHMSNLICTSLPYPASLGFQRTSDDTLGPLTRHGPLLLQLCESSNIVILNGLPSFPSYSSFNCWSHCGDVNVVDYALLALASFPPSTTSPSHASPL